MVSWVPNWLMRVAEEQLPEVVVAEQPAAQPVGGSGSARSAPRCRARGAGGSMVMSSILTH